jgi:hypothetical protein
MGKTKTTIKLGGETTPREVNITTGVLYRFEKNGGKLTNVKETPIIVMCDLICQAIKTKDENVEDLIDLLPNFGVVAEVFESAMENSGMKDMGKTPSGKTKASG